jgi:hypothetical protein
MGQYQAPLDDDLLRVTLRDLWPKLRSLLVVLTPPLRAPGTAGDNEEEGASQLPLDQYGFASMVEYLREPGKKRDLASAFDTSRVAIAFEKHLRHASRRDWNVAIKKRVDVDLIRCSEGNYIRRQRLLQPIQESPALR